MQRPHLLFVTGKLAETALRHTLQDLAPRAGFDYSVAVLPITVAALATTPWIARHLRIPEGIVIFCCPGYRPAISPLCNRSPSPLSSAAPKTCAICPIFQHIEAKRDRLRRL